MKSLMFILIVLFLTIYFAEPAKAQTVVANGMLKLSGTAREVNVTYWDEASNTIVSEVFNAPDVEYIDGVHVVQITGPALGAGSLFDLPTFALAKFHWWVFGFVLLPEAQRQYADCIGHIKGWQKRNHLSPLIDEPGHSLYPYVLAVRQYQVNFDNFQSQFGALFDPSRPPTKDEAIIDANAALQTFNDTVHHVNACNDTMKQLGIPTD